MINHQVALHTHHITATIATTWLAEQSHIAVTSLSLPYLQHELILNQGDIFKVNDSPEEQRVIYSPITPQCITTKAYGRYQALGIMFQPVGIYTTYGISALDFAQSNSAVRLFDKATELDQRFAEATAPADRLQVLINFFQQNTVNKPCPPIVLRFLKVVSSLACQPIEIQKIAKDLHFSVKHLIATFKSVVGITPHKYLQLLQLNHALQKMIDCPDQTLTKIALEHGFYDQSHFIRVFKRYAGISPLKFRAQQAKQSHGFINTLISKA
ncbi:AraC family transcriptional regulator [Microscilla marina]|uniref:Transcriptional regulator, AraC/XylS family, putative n=1 Tax=Microscilla marina ATCC 23134 TaxID=313606 RepID=A1ZHA8_MICM2|nr:helix-turn-helix domain-containing protein [Microscilla marina]EAY30377.1 transcriptional regulator, AraC/XylS family, putative [Microscilla marina ATCC 23134]